MAHDVALPHPDRRNTTPIAWLALAIVPGGLAAVALAIGLAIGDFEGPVWVLALLPVVTALVIGAETRGRGRSWRSTAAWAVMSGVASLVMLVALWLAWAAVYCAVGDNACFS